MKHISAVCIYHAGCMDGWASAYVTMLHLHKKYRSVSAKYIAANYGDTPPDVTGMEVYIVDFSYPRETLIEMNSKATSLLIIDHHKTAQKALEGLDFCVFDMNKSGATLTWDTLMGEDEDMPPLLKYIEDRDLWNWKLDKSREVSEALRIYPMEFDVWDALIEPEQINVLMAEGTVLLKKQQREVGGIITKCKRTVTLEGHQVPCVNASIYQSEIGEAIAADADVPFGIIWYMLEDGDIVYSLRSNKVHGIDVSEIAKKYGGGGHKNAAGFKLDHLLWLK